ncbi:uncharacterized protein EV422DRAFT_1055 [Fimicolochytrium jonesii]|uniref:uncharacterized protein n=1 Tax=Fimicolochytrium jonesii TaxID=1396493 RepID=UPI0022FEFD97|nr:uncharacterized protein EV422DRAFT_1055 [Fimicolochytrium jonesii]KAI8826552.1 hypothetical protein EV422DRAFT_1055 [Fimicolochytrium jonesii]
MTSTAGEPIGVATLHNDITGPIAWDSGRTQRRMLSHYAEGSHYNPSVPAVSGTGRYARIGTNTRNASDLVFAFGSVQDDVQRYRTDVANAERERRQADRDRRTERIQLRRNWLTNIDASRWDRMADQQDHAERVLDTRRASWRSGLNGGGYDPVTTRYAPTPAGKDLAAKDQEDMRLLAKRATKLYLHNNTFDPIRGEDIQAPPAAVPKPKSQPAAEPQKTPSAPPSSAPQPTLASSIQQQPQEQKAVPPRRAPRFPVKSAAAMLARIVPPDTPAYRAGFEDAVREIRAAAVAAGPSGGSGRR